MKMSKFTGALTEDLKALGKLGGADVESAVLRLIPALEPVLRTRLQEALAEVAQELKDHLPGGRIEVRVTGEDVEFVYLQDESAPRDWNSELNARITLRLPDDLKSRIEQAATVEGISLNSWLLKASERGSFSVSSKGVRQQLKGKGRS
jgi:hypothetical protein